MTPLPNVAYTELHSGRASCRRRSLDSTSYVETTRLKRPRIADAAPRHSGAAIQRPENAARAVHSSLPGPAARSVSLIIHQVIPRIKRWPDQTQVSST
jgi:hypothetical protein